jgi:two-component system sensor kinase FixL
MIPNPASMGDSGKPLGAYPWTPALYILTHIALDAASFVQPVLKLGITPMSPQTGLAVAFLISRRKGFWWVVLALLLSEVIVRGVPRELWSLPLQALGLAGIYQFAAVASRKFADITAQGLLRQTLIFVAIAAATAITAALYSVGVYVMTGLLPTSSFWSSVARFWVGDLNGILLLTPLLMKLGEFPDFIRGLLDKKWQATGIVFAVIAAFSLIFALGDPEDLRFFYFLFVPAIAAALIWGVPGFLVTAVTLQIGLVIGVQRLPEVAPLVDLQYLMSTLLITGLALGAVVKEREISSRLALQREQQLRDTESSLARATRTAITGELAATLAHELNQPMTALIGYLRAAEIMVRSGSTADPRVGTTLQKAADEALRTADILRRIRNFYAGKDPQIERLAIGPVVRNLVETVRSSAGSKQFVLHPGDADDLIVAADRVFIEVILANLLANAFDSVRHVDHGKVELSIVSDKTFIILRVDDNGGGVSDSIAPNLFKPFITSKQDGMGVGLAVSRSLAEACGGELRQGTSTLGGACFELHLKRS